MCETRVEFVSVISPSPSKKCSAVEGSLDYKQLRADYDAAFDQFRRADWEFRSIRQELAPDKTAEEAAQRRQPCRPPCRFPRRSDFWTRRRRTTKSNTGMMLPGMSVWAGSGPSPLPPSPGPGWRPWRVRSRAGRSGFRTARPEWLPSSLPEGRFVASCNWWGGCGSVSVRRHQRVGPAPPAAIRTLRFPTAGSSSATAITVSGMSAGTAGRGLRSSRHSHTAWAEGTPRGRGQPD